MIVNERAGSKVKKQIRCCIDLGSTYARLLAVGGFFGPRAPRFDDVREERIHVGWGADLLVRGRIGPDAADRAARVLETLVDRARAFGCPDPAVLATNALRSAPDRDEVRQLLERRARARVRVLSGTGEAALGFIGAASTLEEGTPAVLADPGGTSTEIAWGAAGRVDGTLSIGWGTHSAALLLRRFPGGAAPGACRRAALSLAGAIDPALAVMRGRLSDSSLPGGRRAPTILMTGGTAVAIAAIARHIRRGDPLRIDHELRETVDLPIVGPRIMAALRGAGARRYPVEEERRKLLLPGLILVLAVARGLGSTRPTVTARDLRWGAVLTGEPIPEEYLADE
ncbi:MAG: hypothetical protein PHQ19_07915 [Candidatus Krumholzibacteria bacterium]|nr:hypothetical protein [Candidatus Krumholzibacteria bacterium]